MQSTVVRLSAVLAIAAAPGWALGVNKCTDPKTGKVSYSDTACPAPTNDTRMEWRPSAATNAVGLQTPSGTRAVMNRQLKAPPQGAALAALYQRWVDADLLAGATSRIALAQPMAALQELRRQIDALKVDGCMDDARRAFALLAERTTAAYLAFMRDDYVSAAVFQRSEKARLVTAFEGDVERAKCGPA